MMLPDRLKTTLMNQLYVSRIRPQLRLWKTFNTITTVLAAANIPPVIIIMSLAP